MTQVILIGTGTPNPDPFRSGPCVGIYSQGTMVLIDSGTGLVRNLNRISHKLKDFQINQLQYALLTHLHSDHTLGLADLILTPWILGRQDPLKLYGPKGTKDMAGAIMEAYKIDIQERIQGLEQANPTGCSVLVNELDEKSFQINNIFVEAIPVNHGNFESYAYKITTDDKTIVVSGDTAPCDELIDASKNCDILIHEVYYSAGLETRSKKWQNYHKSVHTSAVELGKIAQAIKPKSLVLYHQLFMQEDILNEDMQLNNRKYKYKILQEIELSFKGKILYGEDLMIIE